MKKPAATRRVSRKPPIKKAKAKPKPVPPVDTEPNDPASPLKNTKWETFVGFVLKGLSLTDAYLAVYGGNRKEAEASGSRLSRNVKVAARLEWLKKAATEKVVQKVALDKEEVVRWCLQVRDTSPTLVEMAVMKHRMLLMAKRDADGVLPDGVEELTPEETAALSMAQELTPSDMGTKVKMVPKLDSLKLAVDVLGLKKEDENAGKVVDGLASLVAAVRSRAGGEAPAK